MLLSVSRCGRVRLVTVRGRVWTSVESAKGVNLTDYLQSAGPREHHSARTAVSSK